MTTKDEAELLANRAEITSSEASLFANRVSRHVTKAGCVQIIGPPLAFYTPVGQDRRCIYDSLGNDGVLGSFQSQTGYATIDAATEAYLDAFDAYLAEHPGRFIVWRRQPELAFGDAGYVVYSRLVIEEEPVEFNSDDFCEPHDALPETAKSRRWAELTLAVKDAGDAFAATCQKISASIHEGQMDAQLLADYEAESAALRQAVAARDQWLNAQQVKR